MLANWQRSFPDCEPIQYELRQAFPDRWVRFHSLPESKRYPDDEDDYATLLARHNTVLASLTHAGEPLALLTAGYSATAEPTRNEVWHALDPQASPWRTFAMHEYTDVFEEPNFWHVFASSHPWLPGGFDPIVRLVADETVANVMVVPLDCRWLLHPYDGGMDVILDSTATRDALKASFPEWLSDQANGM